ncbi:MAG: hypothetical protein AB7N70_04845 [Dehalococcoidia bacterium]
MTRHNRDTGVFADAETWRKAWAEAYESDADQRARAEAAETHLTAADAAVERITDEFRALEEERDELRDKLEEADAEITRLSYNVSSVAADAAGRALARIVSAVVDQADPQLHWGDPTSYAEIKWQLIDALRAALANPVAVRWAEEGEGDGDV